MNVLKYFIIVGGIFISGSVFAGEKIGCELKSAYSGDNFQLLVNKEQQVILQGSFSTPSPNYPYKLVDNGVDAEGNYNINILLSEPEGFTLSVIGEIVIEEKLNLPLNVKNIYITLDKPYNWGVEEAVCSLF